MVNLKAFFLDWYNGLFFISMGVMISVVIHVYRNNQEFISKLQQSLTYDFAVWLIGVMIVVFGIGLLPIAKVVSNNRTIQKWYTKRQEKKKWSSK